MASIIDSTLETRALHLFRNLLDLDPGQRERALRDCDPPLRTRVQALLACVEERDLEVATEPDCAGLRIGPYVVVERIGQGGMGEVFLAERADGSFDRQVAVKRIWAGHAPLAARFVRERQMLARLQHPHIAQLLDGGLDDAGKPWLAMELVRGQDIDTWCDARNAPLAQRVELLRQVCDAVDHAHRQLIVHRDIKPSNLLVDADGCAKLLDFGIARLLDDDAGQRTLTQAMTPAWATPEQRQGKPVTTASDIYQIGLLAHLLLSGLLRDEANPRMSAGFARMRREAPQRAEAIAKQRGLAADALQRQLRGDLDSIVALATAQDPGGRYGSARALADDLKLWLRGLPVQARGDERGYRLRRAARRWWPALAAGVAGLAFLGFHVYTLQGALDRTERERARAVVAEQRATRERDNARLVSEQLVGLFAASSPDGTRSDQLRARDLLGNAEAAFTQSGMDQRHPAAAALVWDALSRIHGGMGDDAHALRVQARAVAAARRARDPQLLAEALRTQAWAYYRHDQPAEARRSAEEARRALEQAGLQTTPLYARVQNAAGFAALAQGDAANGWRELEESLALLERAGPSVDALRFGALLNATEAALAMGEPARARGWLSTLDAMAGAHDGQDVVARLQLATRRARLARNDDRLAEANAQMDRLLAEANTYFGMRHPEAINYANEYAKGLIASGDYTVATAVLSGALQDAIAALPAEHTLTQDIRGQRGIAALLQGDLAQAGTDLRAVTEWRQRKAQADIGQGPALERLALARTTCAARLPVMASKFEHEKRAEPWQRRLAQRWAGECAAPSATAQREP